MTRQTKWRIDYPRPVILEVPFAARRHLTGLILSAGVHLDLEQAERVADIILADEQHRPDPADYLTAPTRTTRIRYGGRSRSWLATTTPAHAELHHRQPLIRRCHSRW